MPSRGEGDVSVDVLESIAYTISIHALRMEGDTCIISLKTGAVNISIHALRVEGDEKLIIQKYCEIKFLSTPSGWRATICTRKPTSTA